MSRLARKIDRHARREIERLRRKVGGKQLYTIAATPLIDALVDDRIGPSVSALLAVCYECMGAGAAERECMACRGHWSPERSPVCVVEIDFVKAGEGLLGFVCGDCAAGPDLAGAILAGVMRDLGGDGHRIIAMPEPGHA